MNAYNVSGVTVIDKNPQRSWRKASEPGELHPRLQLRAVQVADGPHAEKFVIVNETGWNGYEQIADFVDTEFGYMDSFDEAMRCIDRAMASQT